MSSQTTTRDRSQPQFERPEQLIENDTKKRFMRVLQYAVYSALTVFIGFPIYYLFGTAFQPLEALFTPSIIPQGFSLDSFVRMFEQTNITAVFMNSVIVATGSTLLTVIVVTLGGYGLARSRFRGKRNIARGVLFTYMFPPILLGIPLYILSANLGLLNSYFALIIAHSTRAVPFGLWLMWQYFNGLPRDFEEAAWVNGASRIRTLWDVVLPMTRPGLIAVTIFTFAVSWNDFTFATILMTDRSMETLPLALDRIIAQQAIDWGVVLATGVVVITPALILVIFTQKYLLQGFNLG